MLSSRAKAPNAISDACTATDNASRYASTRYAVFMLVLPFRGLTRPRSRFRGGRIATGPASGPGKTPDGDREPGEDGHGRGAPDGGAEVDGEPGQHQRTAAQDRGRDQLVGQATRARCRTGSRLPRCPTACAPLAIPPAPAE